MNYDHKNWNDGEGDGYRNYIAEGAEKTNYGQKSGSCEKKCNTEQYDNQDDGRWTSTKTEGVESMDYDQKKGNCSSEEYYNQGYEGWTSGKGVRR